MGSLLWLIHLHNKFQLLPLSPLSDTGGNSWFINMRKSIAQFLPRLSLASYLCLLVLDSFLTTKRHLSDVQPNYIPIFSSFQLAVWPVAVSTDCFCFTQIINQNSDDLVRILTKIDTRNRLCIPYKCAKFQSDRITRLGVCWIYEKTKKKKKKPRKKRETLVAHISGVAGAIHFKFGMWPPLIGRRLHNKVYFDRIKDCGVMNAWK